VNKLRVVIKIIFLVLLVEAVYAVTIYGEPVKEKVVSLLHISQKSVEGASTKRAQDISHQIGTDVGGQVDQVKKQVLNIKVSDVINGFSNLQRVSRDVQAVEKYTQEMIGSVLKSKK